MLTPRNAAIAKAKNNISGLQASLAALQLALDSELNMADISPVLLPASLRPVLDKLDEHLTVIAAIPRPSMLA